MTINITGTSSQYLRPAGGRAPWAGTRYASPGDCGPCCWPCRSCCSRPCRSSPCRGSSPGGLPVRRLGLERLPDAACVIVANHASYIDGPLLFALLPPRFGFVIKKEASRLPLVGTLLHRLGHHFVERNNRHQGGSDARRILRALEQGDAVAFFPEGTFHPEPGVARFHGGAFALAARTGVQVAPVAIRGTRAVLGEGRALPRWGRIEVEVLQPLPPRMGGGDAATELRDAARQRIAAGAGEPLL
jgi:1-acyl-sn-glycerol-3-phosphate acyltransferase